MGYWNCSTKQSWWAFTYDPPFAMTDSVKIIQDISLLYELSLSLGNSLDPNENCHLFLDTLIRRKSLSFASVWLRNATAETEHTYTVFCTIPHFREAQKSVVFSEGLVQELASRSWLSISCQDPHFQEVIQENKIEKGTYALFTLGNLGFIKLFATNRSEGFPEIELVQLKQVIDKLSVSLEGCFAYLQLKQETQNRLTTQKALEESENKLRRIIDSSLDAVVSADEAGMAVEWSSQAEKMFGYSRQEVLGKRLRDIFIPERHWHLFQNAFDDYLRTTDESLVNRRYEIKCIRKNGEEFLAELSITSDVNEKNRLFVGFVRDITEQRKAKKEVEISRNRMENLISNLQTGILLEDNNRKIVLVNQSFCDIFSIPAKPSDLVGQDCSQAAEQSKHLFQDPAKFVKSIDRALRDKRLLENEVFVTVSGRILERNFIPLFSGEVYEGHLWQYRDITERQTTEQAIRESEEKYRGVLENMDLGLLEVDTEENIIRVNNAFCQMIGYLPDELLGKNTGDLFLPLESKKIILERLEDRKKGLSSVYELQMQRKDGTLLWFLISGAPLKDSSGKIIGSIGIHFDLTARKKLENDLAVAKQVADRARLAERQFLTHMSHEIRTPINAVIGMTHLLNETQPNPTQKDYLDSLRFSANSLLGIIDNMLDFSKIDAGELEFEHKRFDLGYLLKSLLQSLQFKTTQKDIRILKNLDPAIEHLVIGDPTRVNQILTNLLGNALKFTEKGTVSLSTKLLHKSEGQILVEFRVHDTGIGIPDDKHEVIFEYFKQADTKINREFGGTGLGLTIVKQLVEMMGGTIRVESQLGVGSEFILTLPFGDSGILAPDSEMLTEIEVSHNQMPANGLHFLIVEDNLINQKLLCKTIELWHSTVQVANNGLEALEKTVTERFDVILMDIHMPVLGGFEATLAIRKDENNPNKNVPIIALTAAALSADKKRAFEVGMNGFLTKPISPKELQEHILQAIKLSRALGNEVPILESKALDAVDLSYLLGISNNDVQFVEEIIAAFLKETPAALQSLESFAQRGAWDEAGKVVHKLKPNFALLGLKKLAAEAAFIEEGIQTGLENPNQRAALISGLVAQANIAMASISQLKFH